MLRAEAMRYWRLQRAKNLLDHTYLKVNEIASAVDFKHVSSFTREFTKLYGCPPSVLRADRRPKITLQDEKERSKLST